MPSSGVAVGGTVRGWNISADKTSRFPYNTFTSDRACWRASPRNPEIDAISKTLLEILGMSGKNGEQKTPQKVQVLKAVGT